MRRLTWLVLFAVLPFHAGACESLRLIDGWARETAPVQRTGAAFLTLENLSGQDVWLTAARSEQAGATEVHGHQMVDGVMRMRRQQRLLLEQGALLRLKPGGYHLMLFDLDSGLRAGQQLALKLLFDPACELDIQLPVLSLDQEAKRKKRRETSRAEAAD